MVSLKVYNDHFSRFKINLQKNRFDIKLKKIKFRTLKSFRTKKLSFKHWKKNIHTSCVTQLMHLNMMMKFAQQKHTLLNWKKLTWKFSWWFFLELNLKRFSPLKNKVHHHRPNGEHQMNLIVTSCLDESDKKGNNDDDVWMESYLRFSFKTQVFFKKKKCF